MDVLDLSFSGIILITIVTMMPLFVLTTTSFLKVAIVLFMVRNALGVQQAPPNIALYAVALVVSGFIMIPVWDEMATIVMATKTDLSTLEIPEFTAYLLSVAEPMQRFMDANTDPVLRDSMVLRAESVWPESYYQQIENPEKHPFISAPAFLLSELTTAFEIGLLLYLPFVIIDLVVANVLTALGMMMVSPVMISVPFKLLIFVLVEGWFRVTDGLILSYE